MVIKFILAHTERQKFEGRCKKLNLSKKSIFKFIQTLFPDRVLLAKRLSPEWQCFVLKEVAEQNFLIALSLCKSLLMINFSDSVSANKWSMHNNGFTQLLLQIQTFIFLLPVLLLSSKNYLDMLTQSIDYIHMKEIHCQKLWYPIQRFYA